MAIDQPLNKKRGRQPFSRVEGTNSCPVMERKLALVKQRLALLDSSGSDNESDKDDDLLPLSKRPTLADNMQRNLVISQNSARVVNGGKDNTNLTTTTRYSRRGSLSRNEQKLPVVVTQQAIQVVDDTDDDEDDAPLKLIGLRQMDSEQRKFPAVSQTHTAHNTDTALTYSTKVSTVNSQKKSASVKPVVEANESYSVHNNFESTMRRAKEVQAKLPANHPSFVKIMLQSHVIRGFWLGLPAAFCNKHLPEHDTKILLEDENGSKHDVTYLGNKQGFSGGWRGFSIKHNIKVGDVVVFQLVSSARFKVYIVRANGISETDGALDLLSFEAQTEGRRPREQADDVSPKEGRKIATRSSKIPLSNSDDSVGELIDGIKFSDSVVSFDDVRTFSDFNIIVDGLVMDCKFPDQLRRTYYELCHSQKSFLHQNLIEGLNLTLIIGVITETINIADGIRACKACDSSRENLLIWKKTLEAFELLGMKVAFLLKRLGDLLGLAIQAKEVLESQKYKEVKVEKARAGEKMKALEIKMSKLKDALKTLDLEMEEMESSVENSDPTLQQMAAAPW